jgi:hypothetical protein
MVAGNYGTRVTRGILRRSAGAAGQIGGLECAGAARGAEGIRGSRRRRARDRVPALTSAGTGVSSAAREIAVAARRAVVAQAVGWSGALRAPLKTFRFS